jgi:hypothetical protein
LANTLNNFEKYLADSGLVGEIEEEVVLLGFFEVDLDHLLFWVGWDYFFKFLYCVECYYICHGILLKFGMEDLGRNSNWLMEKRGIRSIRSLFMKKWIHDGKNT